jgi:ABC-type molybdate transport system substrate-binding protein
VVIISNNQRRKENAQGGSIWIHTDSEDEDVSTGTSTPKADPSGDYAWERFRKADAIKEGSFTPFPARRSTSLAVQTVKRLPKDATNMDGLWKKKRLTFF